MKNKKFLVIAAHPDDEILGCGGAMARLVKEGNEVFTLILGEGVISRDDERNIEKRKEEIVELKKQAEKANQLLGAKQIFFSDFPDNKFDTIALLDIVKTVEKIKEKIKPDIIFTHYKGDLNIDHQITYKAVLTATRPIKEESVKEIYSFEVPSSTEWNYPLSFAPNVFFDVTNTIDKKIKALKEYKSEIRNFPHPRSEKALKLNAQNWGIRVGLEYAEAFKTVRIIQ
jgi:LmbE family N-acetylglucosaminyl deacetylase